MPKAKTNTRLYIVYVGAEDVASHAGLYYDKEAMMGDITAMLEDDHIEAEDITVYEVQEEYRVHVKADLKKVCND